MSQPSFTKRMRRLLKTPAQERQLCFVDEKRTIFTHVSKGQIINHTKYLKRRRRKEAYHSHDA